jgi:chorismate synthase
MRGNTLGKLFSITSFGESHGPYMGVVIDGMVPNLDINLQDLQAWVNKRAAKSFQVATQRKEADSVEIISGIFENKTLGTPITVIVKNSSQKSSDYDQLKDQYRPGHADQTTMNKYGIRDHRGGGRASGRETISRVIAGYFAKLVIPNIEAKAFITAIAGQFKADEISTISETNNIYSFPSSNTTEDEISNYLQSLKSRGESAGGEVTLLIENVPKGLGEPCFDKIKAELAKSFVSIGSCMGVNFGNKEISTLLGTTISSDSSNFGGIEGGITNGETIKVLLMFKAPSTVGDKATQGRHDPCILPRVLAVVESMAYITLADHFLRQTAYQMELPEYSK